MGMHLHLYASKTLTRQEIEEWANDRSVDIIRETGPTHAKVQAEMDKLRREHSPEHFEHGPKIDQWLSLTFVWKAINCARWTLALVILARPEDSALQQWIAQHEGWMIWGDNDGV